jgi:hypothetical protein
MKRSSGGKPITEGDVMYMVANPVYAGIGPFPQIIPDAQWIDAFAKLIQEKGAKPALELLLVNLRAAFPAE